MPSNSFAVPVTGTTISSSAASSTWSDFVTAFSTCVLKDGTQTITANIPMANFKLTGLGAGSAAGNSLRYEQLFTTSAVTLLGAMDWVKGADVASAATVNLTTATGNAVHITGAVTITAVTLGSGMWRLVIFDSALTLTHHATNNNLPGGANITTAANDRALYWSDGTTVYCVAYVQAASVPTAVTNGTQASTWTWDGSGGTSGSLTMTYQKIGNWVTLNLPQISATSGTSSTVLTSNTALPAAIRPASTQVVSVNSVLNNGGGVASPGYMSIAANGIITFFRDQASATFTNASTCGTVQNLSITYFIG